MAVHLEYENYVVTQRKKYIRPRANITPSSKFRQRFRNSFFTWRSVYGLNSNETKVTTFITLFLVFITNQIVRVISSLNLNNK